MALTYCSNANKTSSFSSKIFLKVSAT